MRTNLWTKLWCGTCLATILLAGRTSVLLAAGTPSPLYGSSLDDARKHLKNPNWHAPAAFKSSVKSSSALKAAGDSTRVKLSKTTADKLVKSKSKSSKIGEHAANLSLDKAKKFVPPLKPVTQPAQLDKLNVPQLSPALNPGKPILQPLKPVIPPSFSPLPVIPPLHPLFPPINEPPTPDEVKQITIVNPEENKGSVRFLLNGKWKGLPAGHQLELNTSEALTVAFDRNEDLGRASYRLSEGTYTFGRSDDGWQLFRNANADAAAAE